MGHIKSTKKEENREESEKELRESVAAEFFGNSGIEDQKMVENIDATQHKVRSSSWSVNNSSQISESSKWFSPLNTVRVDSKEAEIQRREIIKSMSRRTTKNSNVLKR